MLPFSLRCNTCGEYMYRGKKFNSKSEIVKDDDYMGIKKFRFYIKCTHCAAEITFKTDPKNSDYECESGASRNFELWRDNQQESEMEDKARVAEEEIDAMKALEHRTMDNKLEMDLLDALDEIKALKYRNEKVTTDRVLEIIDKKHLVAVSEEPGKELNDEEDLKTLQAIQRRKQICVPNVTSALSNLETFKTKTQQPAIPQFSRKRKISKISESAGKGNDDQEPSKSDDNKTANPLTNLLSDYGDQEEEE